MEHHPDLAELTQLRSVVIDAPRRDVAPVLIQPSHDENLDLALHAWN